jgi:acetyltransferase-like isoleucine patch superfamily enzyme
MYFREIVDRILRRKAAAQMKTFMQLASDVDGALINITVRKPVAGKKFLLVGEGSVVEARFVFEREQGEVNIGSNTFIGGSTIICAEKINIGNNVLVSWGCTIIDNDAHSLHWENRRDDVIDWKRGLSENKPGHYKHWKDVTTAEVSIGDKAWIGFNAIILKGVVIGEGAVVGAGSVVTRNVPAYTLVAGNPAAVIKELRR